MYQRIFVPVDGSECARRGLSQALALARLTSAGIRLVQVVAGQIAPLWSVPALLVRHE